MNVSARAYPEELDVNLFELFQIQAELTPDAVAIVSDQGELSYGRLLLLSNKIRQQLTLLDLDPEQPVGVCMSRTGFMVATMLAIVGAGAAYVPMDPASPPERLRRIVENSQCALVIGDGDSQLALAGAGNHSTHLKFIDVASLLMASNNTAFPDCAPGGNRRIYIMYTSGSTGIPKGVDTCHRGVVNFLLAMRKRIKFGCKDRILAAATIGFDVSIVEIFLPLISGGSLLLRDRSIWLSPEELARDIVENQVSVVQTSPATWSLLLDHTCPFPPVRIAINLGEVISVGLAIRLLDYAEQVWNMYGPTEGSVYSVIHNLTDDENLRQLSSGQPAPIGHAIQNVSVYILNEAKEIVQPGDTGELCVGGVAPARGYYNDEPLTQKKFCYHEGLKERLYHSGDLASSSDTGLLVYHGRMDDQLKIRGMRIEPGEIEAALIEHAAVNSAAVTWYENTDGLRSVVAAIDSKESEVEVFRQWLEPRLPPQMIPSRFIVLPALPRAATGKIDRNAIRALVSDNQAAPESAIAHGGDALATTLTEIWCDVLRVQGINVNDNFFTVGGDSLAAVRLVQEIDRRLDLPIPIQSVFDAPTLGKMLARLQSIKSEVKTSVETSFIFPLAEKESGSPVFFGGADLSWAQSDLWKAICPVYAIAYWAQLDRMRSLKTLTELASLQLIGIRKYQPQGPYRLAGHSFGALVALEVAQQLRREGQEVEMLFLLDPVFPGRANWWTSPWILNLMNNASGHRIYHEIGHIGAEKGGAKLALFLPRKDWPALYFHSRRIASTYKLNAYRGSLSMLFSNLSLRNSWQSALGPDIDMPLIESPDASVLEEPALSDWLHNFTQQIVALETGEIPITPNIQRYLSRKVALDHWNISSMMRPTVLLEPRLLSLAIQTVVERHDNLRVRFAHSGDEWRQYVDSKAVGEPQLEEHDFSCLTGGELSERFDKLLTAINTGFNLETGPLFNISLIDLGAGGQRILFTTHHLLAEALSLGILFDDLESAYEQLKSGKPINFTSRPLPVRRWAQELLRQADSRNSHKAIDFWRSLDWASVQPIPTDFAETSTARRNSSARQYEVKLNAKDSIQFIESRGVTSESLLLGAFAQAYSEWSNQSSLLFERIGHGRSIENNSLDLSRTAGFFLSYTPILLMELDPLNTQSQKVTTEIQQYLDRGQEFDLLRWMASDARIRSEFAAYPVASIGFNYRGRKDHWHPSDSLFQPAPENVDGYDHSPEGHRYYPMSVIANLTSGELNIRLVYSCELHREESIRHLANIFARRLKKDLNIT